MCIRSSVRPAGVLADMIHWFTRHRRHLIVLAAFLAFFLLLLLPVPLSGSILGSFDTLFIPALGDTVLNRIESALTGEFVGQSMYPENILSYGETAFGTGTVFMLLRFLGADDVYAVYLTQVAMLTLMALATMVLAERLTKSFPSAVLAGFIFTTSNFVWADIDNLPIHFYFFPLLSLYYFIRAVEEGKGNHLVVAGVMGGLQAYFSMQVYAYQSMMLAVFAIFHFRRLWSFTWRQKALTVMMYGVVALPLVLFYLYTAFRLHPVDAWPRSKHDVVYSLALADFLSHLPGKLIEYPFTRPSGSGAAVVSHSAFPGLLAPFLALVGLKGLDSKKLALIVIGLVALFFSLGTTVEIAGRSYQSPLILFYEYVPLSKYLRVELRAYSLVLLCMSLFAAFGWRRLLAMLSKWRSGLRWAGLAIACAFVAAENISWPLNAFEMLAYPAVPPGYVEYFRDKPEALILDLPSQSTEWPYYIDDEIYVIWQTKHKRNIVGGVNGYYPASRIETQRKTDRLPSRQSFRYFLEGGVTHIIWHESPFLVCRLPHAPVGCDLSTGQRTLESAEGPEWLNMSPFLYLVYENDALRIYELRPG
jgi:hypothetical protein